MKSIGFDSKLYGVVGNDKAGFNIIELLENEDVNTEGIAIIEDRKTTVKTRLLASRESLIQGEQLLLRWILKMTIQFQHQHYHNCMILQYKICIIRHVWLCQIMAKDGI